MATSFHPARAADEVEEGRPLGLVVNGWPVLLTRLDGQVHAVIDRCTHAASELSSGRVRRGSVMCPLHGARFDLASGQCLGAAYPSLIVFQTRVGEDDQIEVAVPDDPPGFEHLPIRPKT